MLVHKVNFSAKLREISAEKRYIKENTKERKKKNNNKRKKRKMKISTAATATIIGGKPRYAGPIPLESNITAEDLSTSETKFNLRRNINSISTSAGNTYTATLKPLKGDSSEALLMQIAKAKLVVKRVPIQSKEELRVFGSTIFEGFCEQNFFVAAESLSDNPEADLDQVQENLKLMYFKPSARHVQMKVMRK